MAEKAPDWLTAMYPVKVRCGFCEAVTTIALRPGQTVTQTTGHQPSCVMARIHFAPES